MNRRNPQTARWSKPADIASVPRREFLTATMWGCTWLLWSQALESTQGGAADGDPAPLVPVREDGWPPEVLPAPNDPQQWPAWREALARFRTEARKRLNYDDALYGREDFAWVPSCFTCCFLMLNDERFVDTRTGSYHVEEFLRAEERRFGGYDAVVLWQAYPRIGLDDRTQFDFYRNMPGGLPGLREVGRQFRQRGVKVFLCYNPWDKGTRLGGEDHLESLTKMVGDLEADGIFLDTMDKAGRGFRAGLDGVRRGVALEGEIALPLQSLHDHHLSWAQWFRDSHAPGVLRNKWVERRHTQHQIARWNWDHSGELHAAWMNGSGMMVWENVFGHWVGWSQRDQSILRAMLPIQRKFARLFSGEDWVPLTPAEQPEVFASQWGKGDLRLWTVVNRGDKTVEGALLAVDAPPGHRFYDLIAGKEAEGKDVLAGRRTLEGRIPGRGIGCFLATTRKASPPDLESLLTLERSVHARQSDDVTFVKSNAARVPVASTKRHPSLPQGMIRIPAAKTRMTLEFVVREVGFYAASPDRPAFSGLGEKRTFTREVTLADYAIDETPVTNRQFGEFLKASGYEPAVRENFLKHWRNGGIPAGLEDHPVVYATLEDARAYAAWAGKRLPTEYEWQYAAQGAEALAYPWGNEDVPARRNGGEKGGTTPVRAYPEGRSPFGVYDLCGNTWELTESEHTDGKNRFVMLKGGCYYRAEGSIWYFDGGPRPNRHLAKMLLFWPGVDRCATVGFRCAADG